MTGLAPKKSVVCRAPAARGATAACSEVRFTFKHGGVPAGAGKDIFEMTTNGIGFGKLDDDGRTVTAMNVRVVRTIEYDTGPNTTGEGTLVFRADTKRDGLYGRNQAAETRHCMCRCGS